MSTTEYIQIQNTFYFGASNHIVATAVTFGKLSYNLKSDERPIFYIGSMFEVLLYHLPRNDHGLA